MKLWRVASSICACAVGWAAQVPAGTELQVRLTSSISSAKAKANDPVQAVVIAPVVIDGKVALPAGTNLKGSVIAVRAAADSVQAELSIRFTEAANGSAKMPIAANISKIDNARESVDEQGRVIGIAGNETFSARIDQGIAKLSNNSKFAALAGIIQGAKQQLKIEDADPNISLEAGTELEVRLTGSVNWTSPDTSPFSKLQPIQPADALVDLVNSQPFRTRAESPPRPSDMTNLMFLGSEAQLKDAFAKAGWSAAARLSTESKMETARAIIEARGYKEGPMSVLLLAGRPPDLSFQKGNNTFAQRHHLRVFRRPETFNGMPVWVCSSTHDIAIDFSESDHTFIHKIDPNIDLERAKVVSDLIFTGLVRAIALVDRPAIPKDATNATGDALMTDGKMAVLQLAP